jgi:hypothetical protein
MEVLMPIDDKNILTEFTEHFHNGDCLAHQQGKMIREIFIFLNRAWEVRYTYGKAVFYLLALDHVCVDDLAQMQSRIEELESEDRDIYVPYIPVFKDGTQCGFRCEFRYKVND